MLAAAQTIVGLFITLDRDLVLWWSVLVSLLAVALVALFVRRRGWRAMVFAFIVVFVLGFALSHVFFKLVLNVPMFRVETVSIKTNG